MMTKHSLDEVDGKLGITSIFCCYWWCCRRYAPSIMSYESLIAAIQPDGGGERKSITAVHTTAAGVQRRGRGGMEGRLEKREGGGAVPLSTSSPVVRRRLLLLLTDR